MAIEKVDILAIGVHPDDVELSCSGTLLKAVAAGKKIGILDLTQGELGTRGSASIRLSEAKAAAQVLKTRFRENANLRDGFFQNDEEAQLKIIRIIRACKPDVVLCNALRDRHPDHPRSAELEKVACFLSGLRRIETETDGKQQDAWRPKLVLHYLQDYFEQPTLVVDISEHWEERMKSILAYESQFYNPNSEEPASSISNKEFLDIVEGKAKMYGRYIGAIYGEGFVAERPIGVQDLLLLG
ncbi:MAG: bacillithiol biosynthesis deacetylase BshB1 [Cryomorphaceae bacterium]